MTVRARILPTMAIVLFLGAAGCSSSPAPSRQPTATSAPTPTPTPAATSEAPLSSVVVIGADGLAVHATNGEEISFFPYDTDPATAIADLTRVFSAEPAIEHFAGDQICEPERLEYAWSGLSIHVEGDRSSATRFSAGAEKGANDSEIVVQTEHGGQIGGSFIELVSGIPDALSETWDYEGERWDVVMDGLTAHPPAGEEDGFAPGVRIHAIDDEIFNIYAPVSLMSDC